MRCSRVACASTRRSTSRRRPRPSRPSADVLVAARTTRGLHRGARRCRARNRRGARDGRWSGLRQVPVQHRDPEGPPDRLVVQGVRARRGDRGGLCPAATPSAARVRARSTNTGGFTRSVHAPRTSATAEFGGGTDHEPALRSSNCAYLRLGQVVGMTNVVATAKALGSSGAVDEDRRDRPVAAARRDRHHAARHGVGVRTLANDGLRVDPIFVTRSRTRSRRQRALRARAAIRSRGVSPDGAAGDRSAPAERPEGHRHPGPAPRSTGGGQDRHHPGFHATPGSSATRPTCRPRCGWATRMPASRDAQRRRRAASPVAPTRRIWGQFNTDYHTGRPQDFVEPEKTGRASPPQRGGEAATDFANSRARAGPTRSTRPATARPTACAGTVRAAGQCPGCYADRPHGDGRNDGCACPARRGHRRRRRPTAPPPTPSPATRARPFAQPPEGGLRASEMAIPCGGDEHPARPARPPGPRHPPRPASPPAAPTLPERARAGRRRPGARRPRRRHRRVAAATRDRARPRPEAHRGRGRDGRGQGRRRGQARSTAGTVTSRQGAAGAPGRDRVAARAARARSRTTCSSSWSRSSRSTRELDGVRGRARRRGQPTIDAVARAIADAEADDRRASSQSSRPSAPRSPTRCPPSPLAEYEQLRTRARRHRRRQARRRHRAAAATSTSRPSRSTASGSSRRDEVVHCEECGRILVR